MYICNMTKDWQIMVCANASGYEAVIHPGGKYLVMNHSWGGYVVIIPDNNQQLHVASTGARFITLIEHRIQTIRELIGETESES